MKVYSLASNYNNGGVVIKQASLLLILLTVLTGCGKSTGVTMESAIQKEKLTVSDKIVKLDKIVYQEDIKNGALVFYTTDQEYIGIASLSKTAEGWKFENGNFLYLSYHRDDDLGEEMTWAIKTFPRTLTSDEEDYIGLYFGFVKHPDITQVYVRAQDLPQHSYKAQILTEKRMWVTVIQTDAINTMINNPDLVEIVGLSKGGNVLYRYPNR